MDRCIIQGSLRLPLEWGFASVDAKARKAAVGTHLSQVGSSFGRGWGFSFAYSTVPYTCPQACPEIEEFSWVHSDCLE